MILPGLVGPSYRSVSRTADPAECVNWYMDILQDANAKAPAMLLPTPGFSTYLSSLAPGPIRAIHTSYDGRVFVVSGFTLYEIDGTGAPPTSRGTVSVDTNPATIHNNGAAGGQLFITSGGVGYNYELSTNTLTVVLASGATMGAYLHNVFLSLNAATSIIRLSDLDDGTTWPAAQFAQRSLASDPWVSMVVNNAEIWLLGNRTSEVWADVGNFPFPFAPIPGAFLRTGIVAPYSAQVVDDVLIWVAQDESGDGEVVQANGYQAVAISTPPVALALQGYANLADAVAFTYQEMGHQFWVCNFVDGARTWAWDTTVRSWHERGYWNPASSSYEALRVNCHALAFNSKHLVGDRQTGTVYYMDQSTATDVDGAGIRRLRVFAGIADEQRYVFYHALQIVLQSAIGLSTGQGSNPQVMMQSSNNGGATWGAERWEAAGKIGAYATRAIWRRLGRARDKVFRVTVSDPVHPWALIQAIATIERGTS